MLDRRGAGVAGVLRGALASGESVLTVCACVETRHAALSGKVGGFALVSWSSVKDEPRLAREAQHVVALDPPPHPTAIDTIEGTGTTHLAWGPAEAEFALAALGPPPRAACIAAYRAVRDRDAAQLVAPAAQRALAILREVELVSVGADGALDVPDLGRRELDTSAAYRAWCADHARALAYLEGERDALSPRGRAAA